MKEIQKHLFFFIIIFQIFLVNSQNLTPLSICTKGRINNLYNDWEKGGSCGFEEHKNAIGESYLYPAAINEAFFNNFAQCGVCYEMVGPNGAIRVRVEDYCSKNNELGLCSGDMHHFNIAKNGSSYIMGNSDLANITFRMVSCDYSENLKILTGTGINNNYLTFFVLNHNLAVSYVQIQEHNSNIWNNITKATNKNNYMYFNLNKEIFPLTLKVYSINDDYVSIHINEPESNQFYESDGNFNPPKNTYFNIDTLKKVNNPDNLQKCCERDKSDFSPIYKDGSVNGGYKVYTQNVNVIYNSNDKYLGTYSINAIFQSYGNLNFESSFPIRADQYRGVSFSIKSKQTCSNCLYIRAHNINSNNQIINLNERNVWKNYTFDFDTLGIKNNEFNGIDFNYNRYTTQDLEINIDNIILIPNPNAPDAGICFSYNKENNNSSQTQNEDIIITNSDNIYSIKIYENSPKVLIIRCKEFSNNQNKNIVLNFISNNSTNNFQVNNCVYSNPSNINSFNCTLPDNINDDIYKIDTQTNNGLNFTYSKEIEIKKGLLISGNIKSKMSQYTNENHSPIFIIHSKEQTINKGDTVTFNIYPIPQEEYNFDDDDEIIFLNQDTPLYLRFCKQNIKNKTVYSIRCKVSNNIAKGSYTNLYSNSKVSIVEGQTINLIGEKSNGGIIINNYIKEMNKDLNNLDKQNYGISFDILYYDSNINNNDEFPYPVYLYGNKKYLYNRILDDKSQYDSRIIFDKCNFESFYGNNDTKSLYCRFPNFVPAGTYTKLESDGFETSPKNTINLIFDKDFNRSSTSNNNNNNNGIIGNSTLNNIDDDDDSSSGSKDWIVWVIVAVLLVFLVGLVITIIACRKGSDDDDTSSEKKANDSSAAKNNTSSV